MTPVQVQTEPVVNGKKPVDWLGILPKKCDDQKVMKKSLPKICGVQKLSDATGVLSCGKKSQRYVIQH